MKNKREIKRENKSQYNELQKYNISKYVTTKEDWCPNFDGNKCGISLSFFYYNKFYTVKVTVFGNDDTSMSKCYYAKDIEEAKVIYSVYLETIYNKLKSNITFSQLTKMGLTWD